MSRKEEDFDRLEAINATLLAALTETLPLAKAYLAAWGGGRADDKAKVTRSDTAIEEARTA